MKAVTFQGVEALAYEDVPDPSIVDARDVVVRVSVAGLCGSDLHPYFGREVGIEVGTVMGHELLGDVVEVGADVRNLSLGDRVVAPFTTSCGDCFYCDEGLTARCPEGQLFGWIQDGEGLHGAQAEYVRVPLADGTLVPVPEGLDDAVALLSGDILSTACFGADLARISEGDVVGVVGCGPVGLLAVLAAFDRGASRVIAVDGVESRLDVARAFGAEPVDFRSGSPGEEAREATEGRGVDAVIEAVGSPDATRTAARMLRPGGRLAAVGVHTEEHLALSPGAMYDQNLTYAAGRCPARHYMPASLALASKHADLIDSLISHRLPLSEGVDAYRRFAAREPGWTKVVLQP
ncbi:MAG: alcohol dehydrogenase catalytic domain-containing protein [Gemmatimonadota bacterium]